MANRAVTHELYDAMLQAFRELPGNATAAARRVGCDQRMAMRGWQRGWTPRIPWARAMKLVLEEEREAARAYQRKLEEDARNHTAQERERARQDSIAALAQEGQMIKAGRITVLNGLATIASMLPAIKAIADKLSSDVAQGLIPAPIVSMRLLRDFSTVVGRLVLASQQLVQAERESKGEPSKIIGLVDATGGMNVEEALAEIKEVTELYALAKERGLVGDLPTGDGGDGENSSGSGGVH